MGDNSVASVTAPLVTVATATKMVNTTATATSPVLGIKVPAAVTVTDRDARLIAVVSTFLNVHPFGAGVDYIWSYLLSIDPGIKHGDVEELLSRFPECFAVS